MFHFINTQKRKIWIRLSTVIGVFEDEEGTYTVQCTGSMWTMKWRDARRLIEALERYHGNTENNDPDWWKNGGPNPYDSEQEDS